MTEPKTKDRYRSIVVKHVYGEFNPQFDEFGDLQIQIIYLTCEFCGETHRVDCTTGAVRRRVDVFGLLHQHRDPFVASECVCEACKRARGQP